MKNGLSLRDVDLPNIGENLEDAKNYRKNKELAYQEGFDEFEKFAISIQLNGHYFRYHPNINLYVDLTKSCNCDCLFCIVKVDFQRNSGVNPQILNILDWTINLLRPLNPSIQITGGEPTLFPSVLIDMFKLIFRKGIRKSVLNTNADRLEDGVINAILQYNINHVNVSRHHYNDFNNFKIMKAGKDSLGLKNVLERIRNRVRLQCNLLDGEIDTYGEVMQFIAYAYHKLGIKNIAFAQLTPLPSDSFYKKEIIFEVTNKPVDVDSILYQVEKDNRFKFEKYRGGVACYYEIWKYMAYEEPMTIVFKYSDNKWLEKADNDFELLPDIILHTDGTLSGSWSKDRKIIAKF